MEFKEFTKKSSDSPSVWAHFLRSTKGEEAKCNLCMRIFKVSGSTSTLHMHLKKVHAITLNLPSTSIASSNNDNDDDTLSVKRSKMTHYFKSEDSLDYVIARMVSLDGIAFRLFCTSEDLKKILRKSGYTKLPTSPNTIRNTVLRIHDDEKKKLKEEIKLMKLKKEKFALTFDEWTSINNHRYININIHSKSFKNGKMFHNLGLIRIQGTMPAEVCISLIQARLAAYNLTLNDCDNDVLAMTTDGASVMCRVGRLLPIFHQLCLAHGIHLAICDVLYKKDHHHFSSESASDSRAENVENDDDDDDEDFASDGEFVVERAGSSYSLNLDFQDIIKKVRTVVKLFKKSPTKNDTILQKHVQDELQKELALLLDCKTRWSSMATMLERFLKLRMCVQKALVDLKSDITFTSTEIQLIQDLQLSLEIVKDTVEALCRRDATLITADTALRLMIKSLDEKAGILTRRISGTLKDRIKERRLHNVTGTLLYLHNHEEFSKLPADDGVFYKPSHEEIEEIICKTVQIEGQGLGVSVAEINTAESSASASLSLMSREHEQEVTESQPLSFREKLDLELNRINKAGEDVVPRLLPETDVPSLVRVEMALFEDRGSRGRYLDIAYRRLSCIPPTSVESERAFSAAGILCNRIRSRLNDTTLDALLFLRSHFRSHK